MLTCESWKETKSEYWKIKNNKKQQIFVENDVHIANWIGRLYPLHVVEPPHTLWSNLTSRHCLCK